MGVGTASSPVWRMGMGSKRSMNSPKHDRARPPTTVILQLAFQSLGIVYGDLGTSPLYVMAGIFPNGIQHSDDILAVFSLIVYTLTLFPLVKYVMIVLRANDNGDGGTFALYSLLCRYAKVGLIPNHQHEDTEVSNYQLELPSVSEKMASGLKTMLENSHFFKIFLLFATLLGTSMVIGDGVLTPCISVLSAVAGIKEATSNITEDTIVWISVAILILLFVFQKFGTDKVGYTFAPVILIWFVLIASTGVYNFIKYDPAVVIKALNPKYIIDYFARNKKDAWMSLGGVVLCITGTEALFADVGHFTVPSIQISMSFVTYPAVICAYAGQTSYLRKHPQFVAEAFYKSIPEKLYWPMFVVAVLAAVIASQAMISGTFSIIQQSLSLGCFPPVRVVHTSAKHEGQVYIPEINYILMILCVLITIGFRNTVKIGNAYGLAVVFVMTLTSAFLVLIMIVIWKTNIILVTLYVLVIFSIELVYLSSVLYKFDQGGYLPLLFAAVMMFIMFVWNNVYRMMYHYELKNKISPEKLKEICNDPRLCRLPGLGIFYSELVQGIPPIFSHYVRNVPALHSVIVFVTIKSLPISKVPVEERFLFRRVLPEELNAFRCIVRYGYTDMHCEQESIENLLIERLKEFLSEEFLLSRNDRPGAGESYDVGVHDVVDREIEAIDKASRAGIVHLIGENDIVASKGSKIGKRFLINYAFNFLKSNLRQKDKMFDIPQDRMVKMGMAYEL